MSTARKNALYAVAKGRSDFGDAIISAAHFDTVASTGDFPHQPQSWSGGPKKKGQMTHKTSGN